MTSNLVQVDVISHEYLLSLSAIEPLFSLPLFVSKIVEPSAHRHGLPAPAYLPPGTWRSRRAEIRQVRSTPR